MAIPQKRYQLTFEHLWIATTGDMTILKQLIDGPGALFFIGRTWSDGQYNPIGILRQNTNNDILRFNYKTQMTQKYLVCAWTNLWALLLLTIDQWDEITSRRDSIIRSWEQIKATCGRIYKNELVGITFYSNHLSGYFNAGSWTLGPVSGAISWVNTLLALFVLKRLKILYPQHSREEEWSNDQESLLNMINKHAINNQLPRAYQHPHWQDDGQPEMLPTGQKLMWDNEVDWITTQLLFRYRYKLPVSKLPEAWLW